MPRAKRSLSRVVVSDALPDSLDEASPSVTTAACMVKRPKALLVIGVGLLLRGQMAENQMRTSLECQEHPAMDRLVREGSMMLVAFNDDNDTDVSQILKGTEDMGEGRLLVRSAACDKCPRDLAMEMLSLLWREGEAASPDILLLILQQDAGEDLEMFERSKAGIEWMDRFANQLLTPDLIHLANNTLISILLTCDKGSLKRSDFPAASVPSGSSFKQQLSNVMEPGGGSIDLGALVLSPLCSSDMTLSFVASRSSSLSFLDKPRRDIISRPAQSWEKSGQGHREARSGLLAQRLPGRIRRDKCTSLNYLECHYRSGLLAIDSHRLIADISAWTSF
jgi:hypothetical protein